MHIEALVWPEGSGDEAVWRAMTLHPVPLPEGRRMSARSGHVTCEGVTREEALEALRRKVSDMYGAVPCAELLSLDVRAGGRRNPGSL